MSNTKGYTQILVGFERTSPRPLELNTVFDTFEEALSYARYNPTSYAGQIISVENSIYVIVKRDGLKSLDKVLTDNESGDKRGTKYIYYNVDDIVFKHNYGYNPEVIFLDQDGVRLYPVIEYIDKDTIHLSWNGVRSGSFYLV